MWTVSAMVDVVKDFLASYDMVVDTGQKLASLFRSLMEEMRRLALEEKRREDQGLPPGRMGSDIRIFKSSDPRIIRLRELLARNNRAWERFTYMLSRCRLTLERAGAKGRELLDSAAAFQSRNEELTHAINDFLATYVR